MALIDRFLAPDSTFQKNFFFLAKRFVAGETIQSAIDAVHTLNGEGMSATLDYLGEDVLERDAAIKTRDAYITMLDDIRASGVNTNVSIKLTAMGLLIDKDFALENLVRILEHAARNADPFVRIDMEGSPVTTDTLGVFERAYARHKNVGIVLQAYLKRTKADVERAIELGARVRLCKGAYNEAPEIAYKDMPDIRRHYLDLAKELLTRGNYPGIATHDRDLIDAIRAFTTSQGIARDTFEFQMLYGCRPQLQRELIAQGYRLRIYIPFGTHWAGYFYRRVMERRENALFALSSMFSK
ncbi:MAG TPA: proline dehydrogenase family protein [Candidatus Baltobacteraceae bacterium]|jgi:proline dehydrogenase|nr:proline dehydrogenase family protein [Candidatus Baltobacteraceae bacterium]